MLDRGYLDSYRRRRIALAVADVAHERGIPATTGTAIISRAKISRKTFYDLFEGRQDCLRFAFKDAYGRLFGPLEAMTEIDDPWLLRLSNALAHLLAQSIEMPHSAELCLVHSWGGAAGQDGCDVHAGTELLAHLIAGRRETGESSPLPRSQPSRGVEECLAGAIVFVLARRMRYDQPIDPTRLRHELMLLARWPRSGGRSPSPPRPQ